MFNDNKATEYQDNVQLIEDIIQKYDSHDLLTFIAIYQLGITIANLKEHDLIESDLELVQYLSITSDVKRKKELAAEEAYSFIKLIAGTVGAHFSGRIKKLNLAKTINLFTAVWGGQYYRNWVYDKELFEILPELLSPFVENKGQDSIIGIYFKVVIYILLKSRQKISEYFQSNFNIEQLKNISDEKFVAKVIEHIHSGKASDLFVFKINDLVLDLELDKDLLVKVFDFLSHENNIKKKNVDEFMTMNPVLLKPFIKLSENQYALYSISIISTFFEDIMKQLWVSEYKEYSIAEYERFKSHYMEDKVHKLFNAYFPFCEIHKTVCLDDDFKRKKDRSHDIDLVLKYGDVLFIIEAKSHGIDNVIRKGKYKALEDKMKKTIVRANEQTMRLKKMIQNKKIIRNMHGEYISFVIDPTKYTKIYRMAVIFREYGGSHTSRANLKLLGCLTQKTNDFSVITLTDLMVVFDILTCPSERIDYLIQRNDFQNKISMTHGDEMDFLGYYLKNRFDVDYKKYKNKAISFPPELAKTINVYKNTQLYLDVDKPKMQITPFWEEMIVRLENNLGENSRRITQALYRVNFDTQHTIINELKENAIQLKYALGGRSYCVYSWLISSNKAILNFVLIKSESDILKYRQKYKPSYPKEVRYIHNLYLNVGAHCQLTYYDNRN